MGQSPSLRLEPGSLVDIRDGLGVWRGGRIKSRDGERNLCVEYLDSLESCVVNQECIAPYKSHQIKYTNHLIKYLHEQMQKLRPGDRCDVKCPINQRWYPGTILAILSDHRQFSISISYADGDYVRILSDHSVWEKKSVLPQFTHTDPECVRRFLHERKQSHHDRSKAHRAFDRLFYMCMHKSCGTVKQSWCLRVVDIYDIDDVISYREKDSGWSFGHLATYMEWENMVVKLLEYCPKIFWEYDRCGQMPIHIATQKASFRSIRKIIHAFPYMVFAETGRGSTPAQIISMKYTGMPEILRFFAVVQNYILSSKERGVFLDNGCVIDFSPQLDCTCKK